MCILLHKFHPNLQPLNKRLNIDQILDLAKVSKERGGGWEGKKHKCHLLFKEVSHDHQEKGIWNRHVQMGSFNKDESVMIFKI